MSKGSGLGGGKGLKNDEDEEIASGTPKFNPDEDQEDYADDDLEVEDTYSNPLRKAKKTRGLTPNYNSQFDRDEEMMKRNSLQEFEDLEKDIDDDSHSNPVTFRDGKKANNYRSPSKRNGETSVGKSKKSKNTESSTKQDFNKSNKQSVNETGAERQRIAKEKQEFKKQKEKFEAEKLSLEKRKRDFDKQKLEFEKYKDVEMKKINAERQKLTREKKAITRQNDKKKDDSGLIDKLYKEIDLLKEELHKKENKVCGFV